jgi:hypothetical protein
MDGRPAFGTWDGGGGGTDLGASCCGVVTGVISSAVVLSSRLGSRAWDFKASLCLALEAMSVS